VYNQARYSGTLRWHSHVVLHAVEGQSLKQIFGNRDHNDMAGHGFCDVDCIDHVYLVQAQPGRKRDVLVVPPFDEGLWAQPASDHGISCGIRQLLPRCHRLIHIIHVEYISFET
jgi:hypothetical protein